MHEQSTLQEVVRNHPRHDDVHVLAGLLLGPGGGPGRELLQAHGSTLDMAGDTAGVAVALGQEDGLHPGPEVLEIQSRGPW